MKGHTTSLVPLCVFLFLFSLLEMVALICGQLYIVDTPLKAPCVQEFYNVTLNNFNHHILGLFYRQL